MGKYITVFFISRYIKFKSIIFIKGTKIRIIAYRYPQRNTNNKVVIDGTAYTYSEYGANQEKTIHNIDIIGGSSSIITINAVDIDSTGEIVKNVPTDLLATHGDSVVTLNWNQSNQADSYKIRYGVNSGNYSEALTVTKDTYNKYVIPELINGTKYYFVVSAILNGVESSYSNEASATPLADIQPGGNRAILVVTMNTGFEKEFDLSIEEVNAFISWYENKQSSSGTASYAIDKHDSNKGPFTNRKDYMIFDKILTFSVDEYSLE
jgi:hypothetical protein